MLNFHVKPIAGSSIYSIQALVSYTENKGLQGDLFFEETISGYLVCVENDVLLFTPHLPEAYNFIAEKLDAFKQRMAAREAGRDGG